MPGTLIEGSGAAETAGRRQAHWETVYTTKEENGVSWFQENPAPSLDLIARAGATATSAVIDVGGGASRLVDALVERGFQDMTVLDLSSAALAIAAARLGERGAHVRWIAADVTAWEPARTYDVWHDRAAFHFLTDERDQHAYIARLKQALRADGHVIIATFAPDGPEQCSGLPVVRYDAVSLGQTLGDTFTFVLDQEDSHPTPWGSTQQFQFSVFRRTGPA